MLDLRYPIGKLDHAGPVTEDDRTRWIAEIEALPGQLRAAVAGLSDAQLDTAYRPGGWTLRQVVHHLPDSHLNAYLRFKWALTEDDPRIKAYDEARWAELADSRSAIGPALDLLAALHAKWVTLLRGLSPDQWSRRFLHPEGGPTELSHALGLYAWHGRHHLAHITGTVERNGWRANQGG